MRIQHIGYLVKNLIKSLETFKMLGFSVEGEMTDDKERGINIVFLVKDGYRIELVSPNRVDSVVSNLLKRLCNSPYHICYSSDDYSSDIANLEMSGFMMVDTPKVAPAFNGKEVVFLMSATIGLVEVIKEG